MNRSLPESLVRLADIVSPERKEKGDIDFYVYEGRIFFIGASSHSFPAAAVI